ncbi:hypothetical protein G6F31_018116 [Rhizopus arrhizus]|nr:hypothetical protein G6F31_018116 [Rhizopus arrhizus]
MAACPSTRAPARGGTRGHRQVPLVRLDGDREPAHRRARACRTVGGAARGRRAAAGRAGPRQHGDLGRAATRRSPGHRPGAGLAAGLVRPAAGT